MHLLLGFTSTAADALCVIHGFKKKYRYVWFTHCKKRQKRLSLLFFLRIVAI